MQLRARDLVGPILLTVVLVGLIVVVYLGAK
jgi:hypothetical protein